MTRIRWPLLLPVLLAAAPLSAQAAPDTAQGAVFPSRWRFGVEAGLGLAREEFGPSARASNVGAGYACLGLANAPGTSVRVTGCVVGVERVHDVFGEDWTAVYTEPRFALLGSRHAARASWEGGILVQIGYAWQERDSVTSGDVASTGLYWSPGLFVARVVPGPDGTPRWSFLARLGGLTMISLGVARWF